MKTTFAFALFLAAFAAATPLPQANGDRSCANGRGVCDNAGVCVDSSGADFGKLAECAQFDFRNPANQGNNVNNNVSNNVNNNVDNTDEADNNDESNNSNANGDRSCANGRGTCDNAGVCVDGTGADFGKLAECAQFDFRNN